MSEQESGQVSEEEKEAIESLRIQVMNFNEKEDRILLNYIDKLQKVIKKQSYTNKKLRNKIKTVRKERNKQQKENEVLKLDIKQIKTILLDFIPHSSRELELKVKLLKLL